MQGLHNSVRGTLCPHSPVRYPDVGQPPWRQGPAFPPTPSPSPSRPRQKLPARTGSPFRMLQKQVSRWRGRRRARGLCGAACWKWHKRTPQPHIPQAKPIQLTPGRNGRAWGCFPAPANSAWLCLCQPPNHVIPSPPWPGEKPCWPRVPECRLGPRDKVQCQHGATGHALLSESPVSAAHSCRPVPGGGREERVIGHRAAPLGLSPVYHPAWDSRLMLPSSLETRQGNGRLGMGAGKCQAS